MMIFQKYTLKLEIEFVKDKDRPSDWLYLVSLFLF